MTRNISISLWFGSYITSYFAWHTCLPNPVTDWKSLISTDRLHLVLCINMCLNLPKAWVLCCIPGTVSALKSVWHPAESLPQSHCLLRALQGSQLASSLLRGGQNVTKDNRLELTQDTHLGQGRDSVQGAGFYLCFVEEIVPCLKGYGNSGENINKGKRPLPKVFN